MSSCTICGSDERQEKLAEEVFRIDGQYVLVDQIPANVCNRCGEDVRPRNRRQDSSAGSRKGKAEQVHRG